MASRIYRTGRTRVIRASGTLVLFRCGGHYAASGGNAGFLGSDFYHGIVYSSPPSALDFGGASVTLHLFWDTSGFSPSGINITIVSAFNPDVSHGGSGFWETKVLLNGTYLKRWIFSWDGQDAPPEPPAVLWSPRSDIPPEILRFTLTVDVPVAETVVETDSPTTFDDARPAAAHDPAVRLGWVPNRGSPATVDVTLTCPGIPEATGSQTMLATDVFKIDPVAGGVFISTKEALSIFIDGFGAAHDIAAGANVLYAQANALASDGTLERWEDSFHGSPIPGALTDIDLLAPVEGFGGSRYGIPVWNCKIVGAVRDWDAPITGVHVQFAGAPHPPDPALTEKMTATVTIDQEPGNPTLTTPAAYLPSAPHPTVLRYGPAWNALSIDRAKTLVAEDFSVRWTGSALSSGPTIGGGELVATGDAGTPTLHKTIQSDFHNMIVTGIDSWWTSHSGSFGAEVPADVHAWWDATGDRTGIPHRGDWWRIGMRMLPESDIFNWSAYRYADIHAFADQACAAQMTLTWDEITFGSPDPGWVTSGSLPHAFFSVGLAVTSRNATWPLAVPASAAPIRIDLASRAGHHGLRYLREISIGFPTGRTLHLRSITLTEVARPRIDVHHPGTFADIAGPHLDSGVIGALSDGKSSLFLQPGATGPVTGMSRPWNLIGQGRPGSVWGWPCLRALKATEVNAFYWGSHLASELATEISLQEGWSASVAGSADASGPNYAIHLDEVFGVPCPATLHARRSCGAMLIYPRFADRYGPIGLESNLGNSIVDLVFDPNTGHPTQNAPIEADAPSPSTTPAVTGKTDASGYGRLSLKTEEADSVFADKGSGTESSRVLQSSSSTISRTWWATDETAKAKKGPPIDYLDYAQNRFLGTFLVEGQDAGVVQWESGDLEFTLLQRTILSEPVGTPSQCILGDHARILAGIVTGALRVWYSTDNWVTDRTGTSTLIDDAHTWIAVLLRPAADGNTLHLWPTDDGGQVWHSRSPDGGQTWLNDHGAPGLSPVIGFPVCRPERGDARQDRYGWKRLHPTGTSLSLYRSPDGVRWSLDSSVADPAQYGWLLILPDGRHLVLFHDGDHLASAIGTRSPGDHVTWSGPSIIGACPPAGPAGFCTGTKAVAAIRVADETLHFATSRAFGAAWGPLAAGSAPG